MRRPGKLRERKVQRESLFLKLESKESHEEFLSGLLMRGIPR
jgi:hypothetical protein